MARDVAVGFLYHAGSGRVLLHLRAADRPPSAGQWAFFGGGAEPADGGDLLATWCRELREELGAARDPARVVALWHGTYPDGSRWREYWAPWPTTATAFVLTEGGTPGIPWARRSRCPILPNTRARACWPFARP